MTTGPTRIAMPSWFRPHSRSEPGAPEGGRFARLAVPLLAVIVLASGVAAGASISGGPRPLAKQGAGELRAAAHSAPARGGRYLEARGSRLPPLARLPT